MLVPYNGSAEVTQGLLTKSVDFTFDGTSAAASLIQSGQFRVLAKFDDRPFPPAPDVPMVQTAVPEPRSDHGLARARRAEGHAARDRRKAPAARWRRRWPIPPSRPRPTPPGSIPPTSTPAEFAAFIKTEADRWSKVVAETGMKYD